MVCMVVADFLEKGKTLVPKRLPAGGPVALLAWLTDFGTSGRASGQFCAPRWIVQTQRIGFGAAYF
jgi:hypothetical protein